MTRIALLLVALAMTGCIESEVILSLAPDGPPFAGSERLPNAKITSDADGRLTLTTEELVLGWGASLSPIEANRLRGDLSIVVENLTGAPLSVHWTDARLMRDGREEPLYVTAPNRRVNVEPPQQPWSVGPRGREAWSVGLGPADAAKPARGTGPFAHYEAWLPTRGRLFPAPRSERQPDLETAGLQSVGKRFQLLLPVTVNGRRIEYRIPVVVSSWRIHHYEVGLL
jgi:hypothetical protein